MQKAALALAEKIADGFDPAMDATWKGFTLAQALQLHLDGKTRSERTVADYRDTIDRYLSDWKALPIATLSRPEVRQRHRRITKAHGPYAANKAMRVLRAFWNRARRQYPRSEEHTSDLQSLIRH